MKRVFAISLLFVYLFSSTELSELAKLPFLIEHYQEHRADGKDLSFLDFLSIHYVDLEAHGLENSKDKTLPFKAHENCHSLFSQSPVVVLGYFWVEPAEFPVQDAPVFSEIIHFNSYSSSIWQPPKAV